MSSLGGKSSESDTPAVSKNASWHPLLAKKQLVITSEAHSATTHVTRVMVGATVGAALGWADGAIVGAARGEAVG